VENNDVRATSRISKREHLVIAVRHSALHFQGKETRSVADWYVLQVFRNFRLSQCRCRWGTHNGWSRFQRPLNILLQAQKKFFSAAAGEVLKTSNRVGEGGGGKAIQ
jgi:hypothetical protein